ncbi:hypothetical protein DPMN_077789 [Dreissena polymorpha]|uniref:Myb/SANT-like DNA-binding domain-containing protein n=1 Tax=Dreissena polymorpha TaxID=45954 RepID=A0A9D3YRA5_DREPO|nr:hypothetical protein DPMN_077789 [Dreissena polymorpha]
MEEEDMNESSQCHSWSKKEIDILLELVIENKNLLEGKHGPSVTEANKRKKWQEIVSAINACGVALRTVDTCKKKLRDLKKNARDYLNSFKVPKTGGGKEKKKLWYYDVVLDHIIGRDSPFLHGIAGN